MNKVSMRLDYVTEKYSLEDQFKIAHDVGADGVETGQMTGYDCVRAAELSHKYDIPFVGIGFYDIMNCRIGDRWENIEEMFKKTVECAKILGVKTLLTLGTDVEDRGENARSEFAENIRPALEICEENGIVLLLEPHGTKYPNPFGDFSRYFINTTEIALDLIKRINSPYVKMLFDCYHVQTMEGDILMKIRRNIKDIAHFHIAGTPKRDEPWNGELNYINIVREINACGYDGYFGLEYYPADMDDVNSLKKAVEYIKTA